MPPREIAASSRRVARLGLVGLTGLILQVSLFPHLQVHGARPDLLAVASTLVGLLWGPRWGMGCGLFYGLAQDLLVGRYLGLNLLLKALLGLGAGLAGHRFYRENLLLVAGLLFGSGLVQEAGYALGIALLGGGWRLGQPGLLWNAVLYETVVGLVLYGLLWYAGRK